MAGIKQREVVNLNRLFLIYSDVFNLWDWLWIQWKWINKISSQLFLDFSPNEWLFVILTYLMIKLVKFQVCKTHAITYIGGHLARSSHWSILIWTPLASKAVCEKWSEHSLNSFGKVFIKYNLFIPTNVFVEDWLQLRYKLWYIFGGALQQLMEIPY